MDGNDRAGVRLALRALGCQSIVPVALRMSVTLSMLQHTSIPSPRHISRKNEELLDRDKTICSNGRGYAVCKSQNSVRKEVISGSARVFI